METEPAPLVSYYNVANANHRTPFDIAVKWRNNYAIELWQGSLPLDDIVHAFVLARDPSYVKRFRPVLETQCEGLLGLLNRDTSVSDNTSQANSRVRGV